MDTIGGSTKYHAQLRTPFATNDMSAIGALTPYVTETMDTIGAPAVYQA
jgi:hypothetical protein